MLGKTLQSAHGALGSGAPAYHRAAQGPLNGNAPAQANKPLPSSKPQLRTKREHDKVAEAPRDCSLGHTKLN